MPNTYHAAACTDVGLVRRTNQDSFGIDETLGLYVVCDGMGGAAGGEIASSLAVQQFLQTARQELAAHSDRTRDSLARAAAAANRAVRVRANYDPTLHGMGTTLVGACVRGPLATLVNVGDSRAYRVRDGVAEQMTVDHSYVAESVRRGTMTVEEAAMSRLHSVITRAIGAEADVAPDLYEVEMQPGDMLLLVSDGLTRHVPDAEIGPLLQLPGKSPAAGCRRLIEAAREDGGSDNITCVVIAPREEASRISRLKRRFR